MVKLIAALAHAKINLFLRVIGRRADGYHDLDSVFVPISIADRVKLEVRDGRPTSVSIDCDKPDLADPESNLAARAARAFLTEFGLRAEVRIDLQKEIPVGAGLGGGSSDAGTVLRIMAALMRVNDGARLHKIAAGLGADVPFFLDPRPARIAGIGERVTPLQSFAPLNMVVAVPPFEVPTATIFRALVPSDFSGLMPDAEASAIASGNIGRNSLVNDLARAAIESYPRIGGLKALLEECGARAAQMTGSGSAV